MEEEFREPVSPVSAGFTVVHVKTLETTALGIAFEAAARVSQSETSIDGVVRAAGRYFFAVHQPARNQSGV
jgi:hypothetical protein